MKIPYPQDSVEKFAFGMFLFLFIVTGVFLSKVIPDTRLPCDEISPLAQRVHLQSKVVGEVEIAGEKCQMYNVFSEGIAYEDKDRKCMLSHSSPVKLVSSKIKCPSGTSVLPLDE